MSVCRCRRQHRSSLPSSPLSSWAAATSLSSAAVSLSTAAAWSDKRTRRTTVEATLENCCCCDNCCGCCWSSPADPAPALSHRPPPPPPVATTAAASSHRGVHSSATPNRFSRALTRTVKGFVLLLSLLLPPLLLIFCLVKPTRLGIVRCSSRIDSNNVAIRNLVLLPPLSSPSWSSSFFSSPRWCARTFSFVSLSSTLIFFGVAGASVAASGAATGAASGAAATAVVAGTSRGGPSSLGKTTLRHG
mmetsp:Transcript_59050/g.115868  ORF Transcript_59050/g.115868 Transcript_59050/m.115868 type:complete len:247 (-) Transcript_59050:332-1072(-)